MVSSLYSRSCPDSKDSHRRAAMDCAHVTGLCGGVAHMYRKSWRPCSRGWSLVGPRNRGHRVRADKIAAPDLSLTTMTFGRAVGRATKGFRQPPFRGRVLMKSETRSPLSFYVTPHTDVRSPVVCLSAPLCWVKAEHEENASQRHSTGRATGRSG